MIYTPKMIVRVTDTIEGEIERVYTRYDDPYIVVNGTDVSVVDTFGTYIRKIEILSVPRPDEPLIDGAVVNGHTKRFEQKRNFMREDGEWWSFITSKKVVTAAKWEDILEPRIVFGGEK